MSIMLLYTKREEQETMNKKILLLLKLLCTTCMMLSVNYPCYAHKVEKIVPNNTSPPAIFVWHNDQWHIKVPWYGKGLPMTITSTCPVHKKTISMQKSDYFFIGEMEPSHIGYEGEEVSIGFNFYAIYKGECPEEKNKDSDKDNDEDILNDEDEDCDEDYDEEDDEVDDTPDWSINVEGTWHQWEDDRRFMGYEKIRFSIENISDTEVVERVEIELSPELKSMSYQNADGVLYDYREEFGYTVDFPLLAHPSDDAWTAEYILPVAPSTINWNDERLSDPYNITVTVFYENKDETLTEELDITGNINDLLYIRPIRNF